MNTRMLYTSVAVVAALAVVGTFFIWGNPFGISSMAEINTGAQGDLVIQDSVSGTGDAAAPGDTLTVNYTGKFENGTVFDTSVGKAPFSFVLGTGQVIQGWELGMQGMKVGGKRTLIVGPSLGYGAQTYGPIPGNSTLVFEVELLKLEKAR